MIKFDCAFGLSILIIMVLISGCLESIEKPQKVVEKVKRTMNAGHATLGRRQSEQFKQNIGTALAGINLRAILEQ